MLRDLLRIVGQLPDRRLLKVLAVSFVLAALLFAGLIALVTWALGAVSLFDIPWLDTILDVLGWLGFVAVAFLLFPSVALAIQGLLLEDVTDAVESRHYPGLPEPRPQSWGELAAGTARLVAISLAVNLLVLPLYLALLFFPPLNFILFATVNGWLLGREYFETVALRRLPPAQANALRRANGAGIWLSGAVVALMFTVPFLNLIAPVIGTGFMVHRFHRLWERTEGGVPDRRPRRHSALATIAVLVLAAGALQALLAPQIGWQAIDWRAEAARLNQRDAPPDPNELLGLFAAEVGRRLGQPELVRREGTARVWQYTSPNCVLDLYLYAEQGDFKVVYVNTRARRPEAQAGRWCYAGVIASGRTAAGTPAAASPVSVRR